MLNESWYNRRPNKHDRWARKTGCPVKGGVIIAMGEMMATDAEGFAVRCSEADAETARALGMAEETYDNRGGADGAITATAIVDTFGFVDAGDAAGGAVYVVDVPSGEPAHAPPMTLEDQVGTNGSGARVVQHVTSTPNGPKCGTCIAISGGLAWVHVEAVWPNPIKFYGQVGHIGTGEPFNVPA